MHIGVLGTGDVGQTLAAGFAGLGHQVMIGSRDPQQEKVRAWVERTGHDTSAGTFAEATAFGAVIVLAVLGTATEEVIRMAGADQFTGKVVMDTTNPLDFSTGGAPTLFVGHTDSLGERIQRILPGARVVKAFNIVGHALMVNPQIPCGPPDMFICGDDASAKQTVTDLLLAFGWPTIDIGGIEGARYLEPMCMVWVLSAMQTKTWRQAFKLLRSP